MLKYFIASTAAIGNPPAAVQSHNIFLLAGDLILPLLMMALAIVCRRRHVFTSKQTVIICVCLLITFGGSLYTVLLYPASQSVYLFTLTTLPVFIIFTTITWQTRRKK